MCFDTSPLSAYCTKLTSNQNFVSWIFNVGTKNTRRHTRTKMSQHELPKTGMHPILSTMFGLPLKTSSTSSRPGDAKDWLGLSKCANQGVAGAAGDVMLQLGGHASHKTSDAYQRVNQQSADHIIAAKQAKFEQISKPTKPRKRLARWPLLARQPQARRSRLQNHHHSNEAFLQGASSLTFILSICIALLSISRYFSYWFQPHKGECTHQFQPQEQQIWPKEATNATATILILMTMIEKHLQLICHLLCLLILWLLLLRLVWGNLACRHSSLVWDPRRRRRKSAIIILILILTESLSTTTIDLLPLQHWLMSATRNKQLCQQENSNSSDTESPSPPPCPTKQHSKK